MKNEINPLELWKLQSGKTWKEIQEIIGINQSSLKEIRVKRSCNIKVKTCIAIEKLTGLKSWQYLDGLENLEELNNRLKK